MSAPVRSETDEIVRSVLGSDLRAAGFRKKGRSWSRGDAEARTAVSYRGSWSNTSTEGHIFVLLDFDFAALGHDVTGRSASLPGAISLSLDRLGPEPGSHLVYALRDAEEDAAVEEVRGQIAHDWVGFGLPLVESATTARSFAERTAAAGNVELVRTVFAVIAEPLDDRDLQRRLVERGLLVARSRTRWRYLDRDRHPLELGLYPWSWLISRAASLGVALGSEDEAAALAVLSDATAGMLSTRFHAGSDQDAASTIARHLGVAVPTFSEMAPGNEDV